MRPSDAEVRAFLDEHRAAFGAIWPVQFMMVSLAPTLLGAFRGAHFFYYYCCCCCCCTRHCHDAFLCGCCCYCCCCCHCNCTTTRRAGDHLRAIPARILDMASARVARALATGPTWRAEVLTTLQWVAGWHCRGRSLRWR